MARGSVDWAACEADYRTGTFSNRQLAAKHGCAESAIRDRVKRYEWQKDLSAAVREATNAKLVRTELRGDVRTANARPDREIIEEASDERANVVLRHRRDIAQLSVLRDTLIEKAKGLVQVLDADLASLTEDERKKAEKLQELVSVSDVASMLESLSRTTHRLIPLERQAFNLDAAEQPKSPLDDLRKMLVNSTFMPVTDTNG